MSSESRNGMSEKMNAARRGIASGCAGSRATISAPTTGANTISERMGSRIASSAARSVPRCLLTVHVLVHVHVPVTVHGFRIPHLVSRSDHTRQHRNDPRKQLFTGLRFFLRNDPAAAEYVEDRATLPCRPAGYLQEAATLR